MMGAVIHAILLTILTSSPVSGQILWDESVKRGLLSSHFLCYTVRRNRELI